MAQSDYLPGTYSRVGTEENPGTFRGGSGGGVSTSKPPITVKRWVLEMTDGTCAIIGFPEENSVFRQYGCWQRAYGTALENG